MIATLTLCAFFAQSAEPVTAPMDEAPPAVGAAVLPAPEDLEVAEGVELPEPGKEVSFVSEKIGAIVAAFKAKEYGPAFAAILMLIVSLVNLLAVKLGKEIARKWMPTIAVVTGIGLGLAAELGSLAVGAGVSDWLTAIGQGLLIGWGASGLYSWLGKKIMGWFAKKKDPEVIS